MSRLTESALIELASKLVEHESVNPPGNEGPVSVFLRERLDSSSIPFDIHVDEVEADRPNVVARSGNPKAGTLLLTGHVDVVPADPAEWTGDPFELRRDGDRLIGRGIADMKGALAAKLLAAEAYLQGDNPGEVVLAFVIGEETTGFGTEALVNRGIDADASILGEPTDLQVGVAQKGTVRYELTLSGRSAHSGRPDRGVNVIDGIRELLVELADLDAEVRRVNHPLLTPGSVTVTEVEAGTAPNIVPDHGSLTVDWRSVPGATEETAADYDTQIEAAIAAVTDAYPRLEIEADRWLFSRPAEVDPESRVARTTRAAAREAGVESNPVGFDATTDARHFIHDGIPTVLFGPGSIEDDAHTVDESIAVDDLVATAKTYRRVLEAFLG